MLNYPYLQIPRQNGEFFYHAWQLAITYLALHTANGTDLNLCSCECFDLYKELVPYNKAWSWQKSIVKEKKALIERSEDCPDSLIILQHQPVYTMGTASSLEFLNFNLNEAPYEVFRTERGGEVTYHGPGQVNV